MPDLPWFVYAMLLAPLGLILFAAAYKALQVRAAREWPSAPGKVVISKAEVREVKVIDSDRQERHRFEERNFANIVYEYSVAGKKLRNNRVSIGEDLGNFEVAETIAKYPAGAIVTVYYNPLHPNEAVLERDLPKGMWGCLGIGTAIVLAILFGSAIGLHQITEFVSTQLSNPKLSPFVVAMGAFGFLTALFALALQRQASQARKWPVVTGTIKLSGLEQYRAARILRMRGQLMFQRKVSFAYRFNGISYTNVHASLASNVSSTSTGWCAVHAGLSGRRAKSRFTSTRPIPPKRRSNRPAISVGDLAGRARDLGRGLLRSGARLGGQQSLRPQRRFNLAKNPRQPVGPCLLAGRIGDQILADLDAAIHQPARLAVHGNGVVGLVADRIGFVVADHEIALGAQQLQQQRRQVRSR